MMTLEQRNQFNLDHTESFHQVLRETLTHMSFVRVGGRATRIEFATMAGVTALCRVRLPSKRVREHPTHFTLRSQHRKLGPPELWRILGGSFDVLLYGVSSGIDSRIPRWMLLDLHVFRRHAWEMMNSMPPRVIEQSNDWPDDGTAFYTFHTEDFPSNLIIAKS